MSLALNTLYRTSTHVGEQRNHHVVDHARRLIPHRKTHPGTSVKLERDDTALNEYRHDGGCEKSEAADIVSMEVPEKTSEAKVWRLNCKGDGKCHEQEKPDGDETSNNVPSSSRWEYVWLRNSDRQLEAEY